MTDDQSGARNKELVEAVEYLNQQQIKVISVGLGLHPEIKELETMSTNGENVISIFSDNTKTKQFHTIFKGKLHATSSIWNIITVHFAILKRRPAL
jgi:biotin synthase-related radical SAM superfamily protein